MEFLKLYAQKESLPYRCTEEAEDKIQHNRLKVLGGKNLITAQSPLLLSEYLSFG